MAKSSFINRGFLAHLGQVGKLPKEPQLPTERNSMIHYIYLSVIALTALVAWLIHKSTTAKCKIELEHQLQISYANYVGLAEVLSEVHASMLQHLPKTNGKLAVKTAYSGTSIDGRLIVKVTADGWCAAYDTLVPAVVELINPRHEAIARNTCLLYTSPSPRDGLLSRMPSSA